MEYISINERDTYLLRKLGLEVTALTYERVSPHNDTIEVAGTFKLDDSVFRPMCRLIEIVDMMNESRNPAVMETFGHLITMLELSKKNKETK